MASGELPAAGEWLVASYPEDLPVPQVRAVPGAPGKPVFGLLGWVQFGANLGMSDFRDAGLPYRSRFGTKCGCLLATSHSPLFWALTRH